MRDFLESYECFDNRYTWDTSLDIFLPPQQAEKEQKEKKWYGKTTGGKVRKKSKNHFSVRDERMRVRSKASDSPALWGLTAHVVYSDQIKLFCENLGAEAIIKKLGLPKAYTKFFEVIITRTRCDVNSVFLARLKNWVACGGECSFFAIEAVKTMLVVTDFSSLVRAHRELPELEPWELIDILRCCDSLQVSLADARKAYRKHSAWCLEKTKKTWVFCGVHKVTLKKERDSLHNFIVDMLDSVESRGDTNELNEAQELAFEAPENWEHVATPRKLINISRKNGWCCKLKRYWGRLKEGEMFFFCEEQGLAHYSKDGILLQAKSPNNAQDLRDVLPQKLERSLA